MLKFTKHPSLTLKAIDLGSHQHLSLESCASICDEADYCNSFDYCLNNSGDQSIAPSCSMSTLETNGNQTVKSSFDCAVYSKTNPVRMTRTVKMHVSNSGVIMTGLAIISIIVGSLLGICLSYRAVNKNRT